MADNMRPQRAAELLKFLMETNRSYTMEELAAQFGWHHTTAKRVMDLATASGCVDIDKTRQPYLFKYHKGATPNFYLPFSFKDTIEVEMDVREKCNELLSHVGEDWKTPPMNAGLATTYAALFCAHMEENDDQDRYEAFLEAVAVKLRQYYVAYRVVKTMQSMSRRERLSQKDGIQYKKEDPFVDLRLIFRESFETIIKSIP